MNKQIRIQAGQARLMEQQKRRQAAEQAAVEARRKAELELNNRSEQETMRSGLEPEHARTNQQGAMQVEKKQEVKMEIEPPEAPGKDSGHKNHLFGTF